MESQTRNERSTRVFAGSLDFISENTIEGWAFDPASPDEYIDVMIEIDGIIIWTGKADSLRPDLLNAGIGNGRHAFYAPIPEAYKGDGFEEAEVRALFADSNADLPKSPMWLSPRGLQHENDAIELGKVRQTNDHSMLKILPKKETIIENQTIRGCLDEINETYISGWAVNNSDTTVPVAIDIFDDLSFVIRIDASQFRNDLYNSGIGNGKHSFKVFTPVSLLDGKHHKIRALASNTRIELANSPKIVKLEATIPAQILASLQASASEALKSAQRLAMIVDEGMANHIAVRQLAATNYQIWNARYCAIDSDMRARMLANIIEMKRKPKFSVVMPTYKTPKSLLEGAVQSVIDQIYPFWELCIADDASGPPTSDLINSFSAEDARIIAVLRSSNGHISAATNSALEIASGEYVCFLDHDDLLTPDALYQMAVEINKSSSKLIYSDEDKIDSRNIPIEPHFKPSFNYSLLLSYNYICHFLAIDANVVRRVGKFKTKYDGSQDHDFLLRCCEVITPDDITHIPLILYHWRAHVDSTASNIGAKNYALEAGIKSIEDHLFRMGRKGKVALGRSNSYRVSWTLPEKLPKVSIIIPTRDSARVLSVCLNGVLNITDYTNMQIIIIDNRSVKKETFDLFNVLRRDDRVEIIEFKEDFNYSKICNLGVDHAKGDLLLMLNNDIEILDDFWLKEMVSQAIQPDVGAVGAKLLYPDGRVQHAGVILGIGGVAGHAHKMLDQSEPGYMSRASVVHELSACTAACLLIHKEAFKNVNGFDEKNLSVAFNDIDLCLKIRALGLRVVFTPYATLRHHESLSRGLEDTPAKEFRARSEVSHMKSKWLRSLVNDPCYSPNLSLLTEDFGIDLGRGYQRLEPEADSNNR